MVRPQPGGAQIDAREARREQLDIKWQLDEATHVRHEQNPREVLLENRLANRIDLALENDVVPRPAQPKVQAPASREEGRNLHPVLFRVRAARTGSQASSTRRQVS